MKKNSEPDLASASQLKDTFWKRVQTRAQVQIFGLPGRTLSYLMILFVACGIIGTCSETILILIRRHHFEYRGGLIGLAVNPVYAFGGILLTLVLHKHVSKPRAYLVIYIESVILGAAFEYFCSLFEETLFGTTSWDYSQYLFNIGGRVNLVYSLFWGVLGIFWIFIALPPIIRLLERVPTKLLRRIALIAFIIVLVAAIISIGAVLRWSQRSQGHEATNTVAQFIDRIFTDKTMEFYYPSMEFKAPT